jgi:hypothetical protein
MTAFAIVYQLGMLHGYAIQAAMQLEERKAEKNRVLSVEDILILDYLKSKSIVYMDDILGYVGWDDNRAARISVGHSMTKLGWERRRAADQRWYYTRGPKAVAYASEKG